MTFASAYLQEQNNENRITEKSEEELDLSSNDDTISLTETNSHKKGPSASRSSSPRNVLRKNQV